jgi:serine acetyltransferase
LFPPLYTYLIAAFTSVFGYGIMALRVFGVVIFAATGVFAALLFEKLTDNVWFGMGVLVCPGVTIGSNVVIGAGSVVTKDIPSGVVAVGNPCRVMREITEADAQRYELYQPEN